MGGLGFIHLGFLAAGAAVAVPILIHLLFRQRARRVEIGTIRFLRVVLQDQARRRRIRRWLLLALRAAGVLLLALLFARPFWRAPETLGSEREVVILIDRSASMAAGPNGATPFEKAQRQATEVIARLPSGSNVRIAYFDAEEVAPAADSKIDPATRPALAGTDYSKGLAWARDVVVGSKRLNRQVFLLTDLQQSGVGPPLPTDFPHNTEVAIIDVGRPLATNLAVEDVLAERTDLEGSHRPIVTARLYNAGAFPARDIRMRLSFEGKPAVEKTVSIDGRSRQLVRLEAPVTVPGLYHGFVEVAGDDDLPFDNRRWVAFQARRADPVLLIDGEPGRSVFGNETYYLETALRLRLPDDLAAELPSPYDPKRVAWSSPGGSLPDLSPFRVVALCNVPDIPAADASTLARFVESGGNLIIFTGDQVESDAYAALARAGVLPARVQGPADIGSYRFTEWSKEHPILSPFSDAQYGDLRTIRFQKITRLQPDSDARVLASTQEGLPLILEKTVGKGHCLIFAFPADNGWGDWAIHRLYLPIVHQLLGYLTGRLPGTNPVSYDRAGPGAAQAPGITMVDGRAVVRNIDVTESDIERTTAAKLREHYRLPEGSKVDAPVDEASEIVAGGGERPDEFWRTVAWTLLIVLLLETFVANRTYA